MRNDAEKVRIPERDGESLRNPGNARRVISPSRSDSARDDARVQWFDGSDGTVNIAADTAVGESIMGRVSVRQESAGLSVDAGWLTEQLEGGSLHQRLEVAVGAFPEGRLSVVSAFGPGSLIVIHGLHDLRLRLPVIFVDTLH